jgi:hypothetical protein
MGLDKGIRAGHFAVDKDNNKRRKGKVLGLLRPEFNKATKERFVDAVDPFCGSAPDDRGVVEMAVAAGNIDKGAHRSAPIDARRRAANDIAHPTVHLYQRALRAADFGAIEGDRRDDHTRKLSLKEGAPLGCRRLGQKRQMSVRHSTVRNPRSQINQ